MNICSESVERLSEILGLENLNRHVGSLLISTTGCFIIQFISNSFLSTYLFPNHYPRLTSFTKFNWDTRLVAWVHAIYATSISIWFLSNHHRYSSLHDDKLFGYNPQAMNFLTYSAGYFLWDTIISGILTIRGHGFGFLLHAISCFIAFFYSIKPFAGYFGFVFLLWEVSTIFLNPHWIFDKVGLTGSRAQLYNGVALIISFFLSRLVLGNYTSYQLFVESFKPGVRQKAGSSLLNTILFLDIVLSGLNVYWFYQMIASVRKRMNISSSSRLSNLSKPKHQ
ncbi:TLC domain-containing protein [Phakopsora pachyrhizi]|nr:TLC domain-containing protein [Phakopsora pachyrhizi]